jgi:hypothetical protein
MFSVAPQHPETTHFRKLSHGVTKQPASFYDSSSFYNEEFELVLVVQRGCPEWCLYNAFGVSLCALDCLEGVSWILNASLVCLQGDFGCLLGCLWGDRSFLGVCSLALATKPAFPAFLR